MKNYKVIISSEDNEKIEYLNILSQGLNELLNILMTKNNLSANFLEKKIKEKKEIFIQLEKEKANIEIKYLPEELKGKIYSTIFNFSNSEIEYIL